MTDQPPDDDDLIFPNFRYGHADPHVSTNASSSQFPSVIRNRVPMDSGESGHATSVKEEVADPSQRVDLSQSVLGNNFMLQNYYDAAYRPDDVLSSQSGASSGAPSVDLSRAQFQQQQQQQHEQEQQFLRYQRMQLRKLQQQNLAQQSSNYPVQGPAAVASNPSNYPGYISHQQSPTAISDYIDPSFNQGFFQYQQPTSVASAVQSSYDHIPQSQNPESSGPSFTMSGADNLHSLYPSSSSSAVGIYSGSQVGASSSQPRYHFLNYSAPHRSPPPSSHTVVTTTSGGSISASSSRSSAFDKPPSNKDAFNFVPKFASTTAAPVSASRAYFKARQRRRTGSRRSLEEMVLDSFVPTHVPSIGSSNNGKQPYVGLLTSASGNDLGSASSMDEDIDSVLPLTLPEPPLSTATPINPQALNSESQAKSKKRSKYTPEQDMLILQLKGEGKSWSEIAAAAQCGKSLAARNRYQVLIGQQGGNSFVWNADDSLALKGLLDEGEKAKWEFIAEEFSRVRLTQISADVCRKKIKQLFDQDPRGFGVILDQGQSDLQVAEVNPETAGITPTQFGASSIPEYQTDVFEFPLRNR